MLFTLSEYVNKSSSALYKKEDPSKWCKHTHTWVKLVTENKLNRYVLIKSCSVSRKCCRICEFFEILFFLIQFGSRLN